MGQEGGPGASGRHASRGEGDARDGGAVAGGGYTVQPGDNLWAIADAQELPQGWTGLYEANKDLLGSDPDLILPGQSLDLGLGVSAAEGAENGAGTAPMRAPDGRRRRPRPTDRIRENTPKSRVVQRPMSTYA
ncbi:hypothetical protein SCYAM73S_05430 [Streptomyces cyaneofuscatus]